MEFQTNPYLVWQIIPASITAWLGFYIKSLPRRKRESDSFAFLMFAAAIWSLGNGIQWISPNTSWQIFWNAVAYIGIVIIPTAWFLLAVKLTGYFRAQVEKLENIFLVFPALTYLAIVTNGYHKLFYPAYEIITINKLTTVTGISGLFFNLHTYYSYILIILGFLLMGIGILSKRSYGRYAYGLLFGALIPLVGNALYIFGFLPTGFPDPTPLTFTVTGLAFAWAIFSGGMLKVVPIAHEAIVENLANGVVVLDLDNNILSANPSAIGILNLPSKKHVDRPLVELIKGDSELLESIQTVLVNLKDGKTNITISPQNHSGIYNLLISEIQDVDGRTNGKLLQFTNISRTKQVETDLERSKNKYLATLDTLQDPYFEAEPSGVITYCNMAFVKAIGVDTREEMVGKHIRHFTARESIRDLYKNVGMVFDTKEPAPPFDYLFRHKDGRLLNGEAYISPIIEGGEVIGSRGFIRDITARVKVEKEIQEQKDLLDGLLQQSPIAMVINDLDKKIKVVNPAFEKLFGYSQEEVYGLELDDILSTPEIMEEMKELTALGMSQQASVVGLRKRKDGLMVNVEMFAAPMIVRGEKYGYLAFYNDISERLKAEADLKTTQMTFRAVLDTLQDPYFEADRNGVVTFVNQAYMRNLGYSSKDAVLDKNFRHFTERGSFRKIMEKFKELYKTKKSIKPFDIHYRRENGSIMVAEMNASPIFKDDIVIGTRGIIRDISERIKAEEVLRQAKESAEYRAGELATINRISEIVSHSLDLVDILQSVCQEVTTIFEVRNAGIGLLNEAEDGLEIIAFYTTDPNEESVIGRFQPLGEKLFSDEALRSMQPLIIQNAQDDPRIESIRDLNLERGVNALMILPLIVRGKAIGTIGMPALDPDHIFSENEIELAKTIASQIAAAIDNAQLYAKTESALDIAEKDLEIGREIQSGFFPAALPIIPGWEIAADINPARQVAGDFYDVFEFEDSELVVLCIADVCDKGVGAALFMVLLRSLLRAYSEQLSSTKDIEKSLLEIIINTNNFIALTHGESNMFAVMFFGVLDPKNSTLYYVNAGLEPPIILNKLGEISQRLDPTGPAVGLFPDLDFTTGKVILNKGDTLFGYTDGSTDAQNSSGDFFGEDKMLEVLDHPWDSAFSMLFDLNSKLQKHIGERDQFDDITHIALRRKEKLAVDNKHTISRVASLDNLNDLKEFVVQAAIAERLNHDEVFTFKLVTEEICTNIIQYSYEGSEAGEIKLSFERHKTSAILKIIDSGQYFSPDDAKTPDLQADWDEREIGGLGIFIVEELMDVVSYKKIDGDLNQLTLEKQLSSSYS